MKRALVFVALALTGCVMPTNPARWTNKHPDWNPPQGIEFAIAQCDAKAESVSGYDWADKAINQGDAMEACMKTYGYE